MRTMVTYIRRTSHYSGPRNLDSAEGSLFVTDRRHEKVVFGHLQGAGRPGTPPGGEVSCATLSRVRRPPYLPRQVEGARAPRVAEPV